MILKTILADLKTLLAMYWAEMSDVIKTYFEPLRVKIFWVVALILILFVIVIRIKHGT